jgi:hypothetical protein
MKIQKRRLSAAIAFSLIISIAATFVTFMPIAFGDQVESFAYLAVTPNVAGKGDRVVIIGWVVPPTVEAGDVYHDYTFTVTKPDLSTDEYYFETSNYEATRSFGIICDQVGTWSVVFSYPGNEDRFGATSQVIEWTVLEETPEGINPSQHILGTIQYLQILKNGTRFQELGSKALKMKRDQTTTHTPKPQTHPTYYGLNNLHHQASSEEKVVGHQYHDHFTQIQEP